MSSEVAAAMAEGVRKLMGADYAVATTGLAGPGGGDGVNPEGTVWVGVSTASGRTETANSCIIMTGSEISNVCCVCSLFPVYDCKEDLNDR